MYIVLHFKSEELKGYQVQIYDLMQIHVPSGDKTIFHYTIFHEASKRTSWILECLANNSG